MEKPGHMEPYTSKGHERKIISKEGIPVRITKNTESVMHDEKVTLGVGEMVKMGEIQEPALREEVRLTREITTLKDTVWNEALNAVRAKNPEFDVDAWDASHTIMPVVNAILEANPERRAAIDELEALKDKLRAARYEFGSKDKNDLYVGKEGTLVYSLDTGEYPASHLRKAHVWKKEANGNSAPDPVWEVKIAALRERMKNSAHVADIHQVEVLPEYQGKGIAKALLDVALWDIEHSDKGVEFTIARVESDNPDGPKMIAAFKKAGFDAFDAGQLQWNESSHWTIVVRENPNFKK